MKKSRKKRKLKRIWKFMFVLILLFAGYTFLNYNLNIDLIGDKDIYLNIDDKYFENGYDASFFTKKLDDVKVSDNIDSSKNGKYYVKYKVKYLFLNKEVIRNVFVNDSESPLITLVGNNYIYLDKDEKYVEPGYEANDNIDGDLTNKVKVKSNVKEGTIGKYEIEYSVTDSSNNKSSVKRIVEVSDDSLLTASVEEFRLSGHFSDVILEYEDKEYDYFKDTIFLGDSNTVFLYQRGEYVPAQRVWGRSNLNIAQINSSTFTLFENKKNVTLKEALDTYKPKYLIVTTGIDAALHMEKDEYIKEVEKFVTFMEENYSDVQVIFSATFPVYYGTVSDVLHMPTINEYNYYLAKICHEHKLNFINFADEVKNDKGVADEKYFICTEFADCGFHLNDEGKEKYIDYLKHLNLGRKL